MIGKPSPKLHATFWLFVTMIFVLSFMPATTLADSLTVTATTGWSSVIFPGISVQDVACNAAQAVALGTASAACVGVEAVGNLAMGTAGVLASAFTAPTNNPLFEFPNDIAVSKIIYSFTASNPLASTLVLNMTTAGGVSPLGSDVSCTAVDCGAVLAAIRVPAGEGLSGLSSTGTALTNVSSLPLEYNPTFTLTVPVTGGVATVTFNVIAQVECIGPVFPPTCVPINVNFLDTVSIKSAGLYDAEGNLIPGATLISQSGFDPNAVPFAAFNVQAAIDLDRTDSFDLIGEFKLGSGSKGIDPVTEAVTLQIGTFSTTIPANSFKKGLGQTFAYNGILNGVKLDLVILNIGDGQFLFSSRGIGANLTGTVNPVTVGLTIGDNQGSAPVNALIVN